MFTRIDHVMICVPDLRQAMERYREFGFQMHAGGVHVGKGTHNAIAFNEHDYIELLAVREEGEYKRASPGGTLPKFIAEGGGIRYIVIQSDDLTVDVAAMRNRGVEVGDAIDGGRRTPSGQELKWKVAVPGPRNPLPLLFIQHLTPIEERRKLVPSRGKHPNQVYTLERAYIVTRDVQADAAVYVWLMLCLRASLQAHRRNAAAACEQASRQEDRWKSPKSRNTSAQR